jgi:acyl-CoA synthetase (AMP-forming)/AMP-acid ligase II
VSLIAMPVAHISGTGWGVWTLLHGAMGVITREFDPHAVFDLMIEHRIGKLMLVPTALQIAVSHPRAREADFSFLRYIYYGGAPIPPALLRQCMEVFGCGFVQMYGMTETAGTIVALSPEDHDFAGGARSHSVGKPLPGVEIKMLDSGEIATRSPATMQGYHHLPEATAETIDSEGWLRTGDAGFIDAEGYLHLRDRIKDVIISGGENIYPAEVENAIREHPGVAEVAIIGVPDEKWGESVLAVVVSKTPNPPAAESIIAWAREHIASFKAPKRIEFVSALPRNASGKILRRELRERFRASS